MGHGMAEAASIKHGPDDFERLLERARVSEREAQAARSVALAMTAAEAAPLMGVSASTVGSYRQRAYAKLGVSTRAEFLRLPEVMAWVLCREGVDAPPADEKSDPLVVPASSVSVRLPVLLTVVLVLMLPLLVGAALSLLPSRRYAERPQGSISSPYGEVPNVVGMSADAAASELATARFCPEFEPRASELAPGTVLEVGRIGDADELASGVSTFSWGDGCTGCYERHGGWDGFVTLVVAV